MKFIDKENLPGIYRYYYLLYFEELYPEVFVDIKKLVPAYEKAFSSFGYGFRMRLFDRLILHPAKNNYIAFELGLVNQNDPQGEQMPDDKFSALADFLEFRRAFYDYLDRYYFHADWLKRNLFTFLYELSTKPKYFDSLSLAAAHGYMRRRFEPFQFEFEGWSIEEDSKDYERRVTEAFKNQMRVYFNEAAAEAKSQGYKLRRRPRDKEIIQRLIIWNMSAADSYLDIIHSVPGWENVKIQTQGKSYADQLRKSIKELAVFGLPVRPAQRKEKRQKFD